MLCLLCSVFSVLACVEVERKVVVEMSSAAKRDLVFRKFLLWSFLSIPPFQEEQ